MDVSWNNKLRRWNHVFPSYPSSTFPCSPNKPGMLHCSKLITMCAAAKEALPSTDLQLLKLSWREKVLRQMRGNIFPLIFPTVKEITCDSAVND